MFESCDFGACLSTFFDLTENVMLRSAVPVFVVEDHNDVTPLFFTLVRSKRIALGTTAMLHLDSHPDLSVPSAGEGPSSWARLQSLYYDTLEASEGGIAEWLVPLLYNGLLEKVIWLRDREQCTQLTDRLFEGQEVTFFCGAPLEPKGGMRAAVTLDSSYYREDDTFMPLELLNPSTVRPLTAQIDALPDVADEANASRLAAAIVSEGGAGRGRGRRRRRRRQEEEESKYCLRKV